MKYQGADWRCPATWGCNKRWGCTQCFFKRRQRTLAPICGVPHYAVAPVCGPCMRSVYECMCVMRWLQYAVRCTLGWLRRQRQTANINASTLQWIPSLALFCHPHFFRQQARFSHARKHVCVRGQGRGSEERVQYSLGAPSQRCKLTVCLAFTTCHLI